MAIHSAALMTILFALPTARTLNELDARKAAGGIA